MDSILQQSDQRFRIILVDDASPCPRTREYLDALRGKHGSKLVVVCEAQNRGPGACRNTAVTLAAQMGSPFVLYNDADDLSHPQRLACVRATFDTKPNVDVVYSTFTVIDEYGHLVTRDRLTGSIREILDGHDRDPLQGSHVWVEIGTERGYSTLTSSVAVRTSLALRFPFPCEQVSEDSHTWLVYAAGGGEFAYRAEIPSAYRVPQRGGSYSRARIEGYYARKATVDEHGFRRALDIAGARDERFRDPEIANPLLARFYVC